MDEKIEGDYTLLFLSKIVSSIRTKDNKEENTMFNAIKSYLFDSAEEKKLSRLSCLHAEK